MSSSTGDGAARRPRCLLLLKRCGLNFSGPALVAFALAASAVGGILGSGGLLPLLLLLVGYSAFTGGRMAAVASAGGIVAVLAVATIDPYPASGEELLNLVLFALSAAGVTLLAGIWKKREEQTREALSSAEALASNQRVLLQEQQEREQALREEAQAVETLHRVGLLLAGELDLNKLVQAVTDAGRELSGAAFGAFFYGPAGEEDDPHTLSCLSGSPREALDALSKSSRSNLFAPDFEGGRVIRIGDVTKSSRRRKEELLGVGEREVPVRSYLAAAVVSRSGQVLGGLFYGHPDADVFTGREERLVVGMAAQAAIALDHARLFSRAQEAETRLKQQLSFTTAVNRSMAEGVYTVDDEGRLTMMNPAAERMLGWTQEELQGRDMHESIHYRDARGQSFPRHQCQLLKVVETGGVVEEKEEVFVRKDGNDFPVSYASGPIREGERILGAVVAFRDITEQKQAGEALARAQVALTSYAQELEERVAERTAKLEESNRLLESFCYTIAHDLRAPLRSISNFTQILVEEHGKPDDGEAGDLAARIIGSVKRMDRLIIDLLAYGRLNHAQLKIEPVDLQAMVDGLLLTMKEEISARGAKVTVERPLPTVRAHATILDQILTNLVGNSLKFVAADQRPQVCLRAEELPGRVRVWVEDNGIGIPAEHQDRVFHVFERLQLGGTFSGTGIGLAIVRRGAERMGGAAGVESTPGKGSRFWFELPPVREEEQPDDDVDRGAVAGSASP